MSSGAFYVEDFMDFDIKPNKPTRQDSMMPQTLEQLIKKYKLDSMWDEIQKLVSELLQHADFIRAGTLTGDRIKGGTLTLGGENNVNGELKVLDIQPIILRQVEESIYILIFLFLYRRILI